MIWLGGERCVLNHVPELQVLADLLNPNGALYVTRPTVGLKAIRHRPQLAASLGDARV